MPILSTAPTLAPRDAPNRYKGRGMPRERARSVAVTAVVACVVVVIAYALLGTVGAALVALAAYGVTVFVLGLVNAGAAAAALMATLALWWRSTRCSMTPTTSRRPSAPSCVTPGPAWGSPFEREGQAIRRVEALEAQVAALRRRAESASARADRLEAEVARLRRQLRRAQR